MSKYGHKGPLVEDEFERRGETRKTIRCKHCNCMAPRDSPEELAEMECDEYARLQEKL